MDTISERLVTYEKRCLAAFKGSAQDVVRGVTTPTAKGGRMRVKTGFLRASLMTSTAAMPRIDPNAKPASEEDRFRFNMGQHTAAIVSATMQDTIYMGFTAAYAGPREYWDGFIEAERVKWPNTAKRNIAKARKAFP